MMRLVVVCLLASCLGVSVPGWAQVSTGGSVRGYVKDEQDAALQDVQLTATSPDAPGSYSATSDEEGYYRLLDLPPGTYTIIAELPGFAKLAREGVEVRSGLNIGVPIVMKVGTFDETIRVVLDTPILESSKPVQAVNISGELQRSVPLSTRRLWTDGLQLTPSIIDAVHTYGVFYLHGSSQDSHVFQIDGADVQPTNQNNSRYMTLNTEAIADVEIKTAAVDASAPLGIGAILNVVTVSGTDAYHGTVGLVRQPKAWNDNNASGGTATTLDVWQSNLSFGGPVRRGAAWFYTSFRYGREHEGVSRSPQQLAVLRALNSDFRPFDSSLEIPALFVKGTFRVSSSHQIESLFSYDRIDQGSADPIAVDDFDVVRSGGPVGSAKLTSSWGRSLTSRLLVSYNTKSLSRDVRRYENGPGRQVHAGTFLSGGRLVGTGAIATLNNRALPGLRLPESKSTLAADLNYFRSDATGVHELSGGLFLQPRLHDQRERTFRAGGFLLEEVVLRNSSDPAAGFIPFHRQIYDVERETQQVLDSRDAALYVQDTWRRASRLAVTAGIRIDWIRRVDRLFDEVVQRSVEVGPRFGVNYSLTRSGNHLLRASWGKVHENLSTNLLVAGSSSAGSRDEYDLDLNGAFETVFVNPVRSGITSDIRIDLDRYHQAYAREWTAGYRSQWPGRVSADVGFTRRDYRDLPTGVEDNGIYENGAFRGYENEGLNQIWRITANQWNWPVYAGFDVRVTKQTDRLQLVGGWTRQWRHLEGTWQPNDPAGILQPAAFPNAKGVGDVRGQFRPDSYGTTGTYGGGQWRDHQTLVSAAYELPLGFQSAAYYSVQSGQWSGAILTRASSPDPAVGPPTLILSNGRLVSNPLATTLRFAFPTRDEGQLKSRPIHRLNLRLAWHRRIGKMRFETSVDVLNALNGDADSRIRFGTGNQLFSPFYGTTEARQPPRSAQIAARLVF